MRKENGGMRREDEEDRGGKPFSAFSRTPCGTDWASQGPDFRAYVKLFASAPSVRDTRADARPRVCAVGQCPRNSPTTAGLGDLLRENRPLRMDGGRAAGHWRRCSIRKDTRTVPEQRTRVRKACRVREGRAKGRMRRSGTGETGAARGPRRASRSDLRRKVDGEREECGVDDLGEEDVEEKVGAGGGGKAERGGGRDGRGRRWLSRLSSARAGRRTARRGGRGRVCMRGIAGEGPGREAGEGTTRGRRAARERRLSMEWGGREGAVGGRPPLERTEHPTRSVPAARYRHADHVWTSSTPRPLSAKEERRGDESRRRQTSVGRRTRKPVGRSCSEAARATSVRRPLALLRSWAMCGPSAVPQEPSSGPPVDD
jgi:hypothetical protein